MEVRLFPESLAVVLYDFQHGVITFFHLLYHLELGATAVEIVTGVVDAKVHITIEMVGQEAQAAFQGHELG